MQADAPRCVQQLLLSVYAKLLCSSWKQGVHCSNRKPMEPRGHCDTAGPHGSNCPLGQCGSKESIVTLQNLMEARSHCDTVGPPGIKETIVTQVKHMKPRSHCDTLGFFPSALQLAGPAHCIMCQLLSSGLCLHTGPGEVFLFVRKEWKSLSRFP